MFLANALTTGKEESKESRAVDLMSVRETRMSYFHSIGGVPEALSIMTMGVVKEMHNRINVTVEGKKMTTAP